MKMNEDLYCRIIRKAKELQPDIQSLGEDIWKHPETGFREVRTGKVLKEYLEKLDYTVTSVALTGIRTELDTGRPGPTIAVVGELDALLQPHHPCADPQTGAAHSCGHHTHAAAMAGAAAILKDKEILSRLCGRILFLGAPGEECIELDYRRKLLAEGKILGLGGKSSMIREGVFDGVDIAFMNHVHPGTGYGTTDSNGAIQKYVTFTGKSVHASYAHRGVNALNGMDLARHAINLLRESASSQDSTVRIHGIITSGGDVVNTLPDRVSMEYMLRAGNVETLKRLSAQFDHTVTYAAQAVNCGVELETIAGYLPLRNCPGLGEIYREISAKFAPERYFGFMNGHDYGCTDMGDVSMICPAIHMGVPGGAGTAHQDDFHLGDYEMAYSGNAATLALLTAELLGNNGEVAKEIIQKYPPLMQRAEYEKLVTELNRKSSVAPIL